MCRPPARCAPLTCTSACCSRSSSTIGSGSAASPRPSARKPRSTAAIATPKGILSRNASSGTTRISVGKHALQTPFGLGERFPEMVQLLPEAEPDVVRQTEVIAGYEQHVVLGDSCWMVWLRGALRSRPLVVAWGCEAVVYVLGTVGGSWWSGVLLCLL